MNKKYLMYLIRSRKVALSFVAIVYVLLCLMPLFGSMNLASAFSASLLVATMMSAAMTYIFPVLLFSFIHSRRSSDQMLALPMSRKEILLTSLGVSFFFIFGCWLVTALILYVTAGIHAVNVLSFAEMILHAGLFFAEMLCINLALFLTADNLFDGVVMLAAYTLMPVLAGALTFVFTGTVVAGMPAVFGNLGSWLSPVAMNFSNMQALLYEVAGTTGIEYRVSYFLLPLVYTAAAIISLKPQFLNRKSERADQLSDGKAAYPLVINVYAAACLLMAAFFAVSGESMTVVIVYYLVLLLAYVIAEFVYRRSISFRPSVIIRYFIAVAVSLMIGTAAWKTNGFGMADKYSLGTDGYLVYSYNATVSGNDLGTEKTDINDQNAVAVSFSLKIPLNRIGFYQEALDIVEALRKEDIALFYSRRKGQYHAGSLSVWNERLTDLDSPYAVSDYNPIYSYYSLPMSEENLKKISQYTQVFVSDIKGADLNEHTLSEYLEERGKSE